MATRCQARKLYPIVLQTLEENPKTRSSDVELILSVYEQLGLDTSLPYSEVLRDAPSSESITRARRRAQERFPTLLGVQKVEEQRCLNEQEYKRWAKTI